MKFGKPSPQAPLPANVAVFSVDPNDQHEHEVSFAALRGLLGFDAEIGADLLTLATTGNKVLGFALAAVNRPLNAIWIQELGVDSQYRGNRIASLTLQEALGSTTFAGLDLVGVSSDKTAVGYYEAIGFEHQTRTAFLTPLETARLGIAAHIHSRATS